MSIQQAINKAVVGGYQAQGVEGRAISYSGANSEFSVWTCTDTESSFMVPVTETFLDPTFWMAFRRALTLDGIRLSGDWRHLWHQFIEHLSHSGTPEAFFQTMASPAAISRHGGEQARNF
jgi:hypothetical protein